MTRIAILKPDDMSDGEMGMSPISRMVERFFQLSKQRLTNPSWARLGYRCLALVICLLRETPRERRDYATKSKKQSLTRGLTQV